jgi:hypothetical protein
MGRWILAVLAASAVATTSAVADEIVIRGPELSFTCPSEPTWNAIASCVAQHSWTLKVVRTVGNAKLVEINAPANRLEASHALAPNVAIYIQQPNKTWQLGGLFEVSTDVQYEVLDFQPLTIAHTHGFRIDIGTAQTAAISTDGTSMRPDVLLLHHVLFCSGANYECSETITSCDALVDSKPLSSFHGQIVIADRQARVDGDGSFANPACSGPQQIELGWQ